mgnify:CR=1 FL=1
MIKSCCGLQDGKKTNNHMWASNSCVPSLAYLVAHSSVPCATLVTFSHATHVSALWERVCLWFAQTCDSNSSLGFVIQSSVLSAVSCFRPKGWPIPTVLLDTGLHHRMVGSKVSTHVTSIIESRGGGNKEGDAEEQANDEFHGSFWLGVLGGFRFGCFVDGLLRRKGTCCSFLKVRDKHWRLFIGLHYNGSVTWTDIPSAKGIDSFLVKFFGERFTETHTFNKKPKRMN